MRAKQVGAWRGFVALALGLVAGGCATQEQVDQVAVEVQQMRSQAAMREVEIESLTARLGALQAEIDRGGERAELVDTMHRLVESNEALRDAMGARGGAPAVPTGDADARQAVAPSGGDEAELRHLVRQLRQIVYGRGALTPHQQQLLLRALRPQRELDRGNPWEPKLDTSSPWEPALDRNNPWH